jgi:class 3 adenylate cyclase
MCPSLADGRTPSDGGSAHARVVASSSSPQRRLLTVLFCDIVGSVELAARLDPEDLRDVLAAYQRHATEIVERHGGVVARYVGDGVLACFGFPAANEDDAERAVGAGLELAAGISIPTSARTRLDVRVGIATGIAVVGDLLQSTVADNPPIAGQPPNLAARCRAWSLPGLSQSLPKQGSSLAGSLNAVIWASIPSRGSMAPCKPGRLSDQAILPAGSMRCARACRSWAEIKSWQRC